MSNNTIPTLEHCGHCGCYHAGQCPRIKSIEYDEHGKVRRIEYHNPNPQPYIGPLTPGWVPPPPWEITSYIYVPPSQTGDYQVWNQN